jgi:hypothetical protein
MFDDINPFQNLKRLDFFPYVPKFESRAVEESLYETFKAFLIILLSG